MCQSSRGHDHPCLKSLLSSGKRLASIVSNQSPHFQNTFHFYVLKPRTQVLSYPKDQLLRGHCQIYSMLFQERISSEIRHNKHLQKLLQNCTYPIHSCPTEKKFLSYLSALLEKICTSYSFPNLLTSILNSKTKDLISCL